MMEKDQIEMLSKISKIIYDNKGYNILALDLQACRSIADYVLIAEGHVERHVIAIAQGILERVECVPIHVEGLTSGDWVVLDFSDIIVHLFRPGLRETYSLERLWKNSKLVNLG
jgi:ribosome-associated protein